MLIGLGSLRHYFHLCPFYLFSSLLISLYAVMSLAPRNPNNETSVCFFPHHHFRMKTKPQDSGTVTEFPGFSDSGTPVSQMPPFSPGFLAPSCVVAQGWRHLMGSDSHEDTSTFATN